MGESYSFADLADMAGDRFNPPPEGKYEFTIHAAEATVSKRSGNDMIVCSLKIAEGPEAGKSIKTVYVSKPGAGTKPDKLDGALRMFTRNLKAVGITLETLKEHNPTMAQIAQVMIGKTVSGPIEHEDYQGEMQAGLKGPMRAPSGGAIEVTGFPVLSAAQEVYGSDAGAPQIADDAGF
jgi:hypothetical protein